MDNCRLWVGYAPPTTRKYLIAIAISLGTLSIPGTAVAYEAFSTHRWITRMAVRHLTHLHPGQFPELAEGEDALAAGADHEDNIFLDGDNDPETLRVMRHFFNPISRQGLTYEGRPFPNSYTWGVAAGQTNEWNWDAGIEAYAAGDYERAFFTLGHVVHLVQDLTVPAHTHLDAHSPPYGDDYERYCREQMVDEFQASLPIPSPQSPIPLFTSVEDLWAATAKAGYWRNMYSGNLAVRNEPTGEIAEMFSGLSWSYMQEHWVIENPNVGSQGEDFWEDRPGWFYFRRTAFPAEQDRADYDPSNPTDGILKANNSGAPMVENIARDLIPIAILHSAALMKLFVDTARQIESPTVVVRAPDASQDAAGCSQGTPPLAFTGIIMGIMGIMAIIPIKGRLRRRRTS